MDVLKCDDVECDDPNEHWMAYDSETGACLAVGATEVEALQKAGEFLREFGE